LMQWFRYESITWAFLLRKELNAPFWGDMQKPPW